MYGEGSESSRPPEGREHRWDAGTKELAGVCLFLSFFPLSSSEPSHPCYIPKIPRNTHFPPPPSILMPPTHTLVYSSSLFFPSLTPPDPFFSLDHPVGTKITRVFGEKNSNNQRGHMISDMISRGTLPSLLIP